MEKITKKLATHLTKEEKLEYISKDMTKDQRNVMAEELTLMDVQYIDALRSVIEEYSGETPQNKKKANDMAEGLLAETLKEITNK